MRIRKLSIALAAAAMGILALGAMPALGADHRDSPLSQGLAEGGHQRLLRLATA